MTDQLTSTEQQALKNWTTLNAHMLDKKSYTEESLKRMLFYELKNENRKAVVTRLKQKLLGAHYAVFKEQLEEEMHKATKVANRTRKKTAKKKTSKKKG